jgi:hypothetical protein
MFFFQADPCKILLEGVELNLIEPRMNCAYMYVYLRGIRTVPAIS